VRRLDRYVLREQPVALSAGLLFFVSVFIVVDVFEKIDTFLDNQVPFGTVLLYYLVSIPGIILQVLPMAMLLSCLLALGQIGRNNEITAMRAAGIGPGRIATPLLLAAFLTSGLVFATNELLLPRLNSRRVEIYRGEIKKQSLEGPAVRTNLAYLGANGQWVFREGYVRRFTREGENAAHFTELRIPGLPERPEDFAETEEDPSALSYWELSRYISRLHQSGGRVQKYLVDLYLKVSFPLTNLIVVVIGTALALRARRGGLAVWFGLSVFISFLYYAFIRTGQALGHNGALPPLLAAWIGNLFFGVLAFELFRRARKAA